MRRILQKIFVFFHFFQAFAFPCNFVCNTTQILNKCCINNTSCSLDQNNNTFVCDSLLIFNAVCCNVMKNDNFTKTSSCDINDIKTVCNISQKLEKCCSNNTNLFYHKSEHTVCDEFDSLTIFLEKSVCDLVDIVDKKCCASEIMSNI